MISGTGDAEVLGDVLDRRAGVDPDEVGRLERAVVDRGDRVVVAAAAAAAAALGPALGLVGRAGVRPARGLRVDHDAAAAARAGGGGRGALAGARVAGRARALLLAGGGAPGRSPGPAAGAGGAGRAPAGAAGGGCGAAGAARRRGAAARRRCRPPPRRGRSARRGAWASSTAEAGALTSIPAAVAWRARPCSDMPCSLASSCTRFFAISQSILGGSSEGRSPPARRRRGEESGATVTAPAQAPGAGRRGTRPGEAGRSSVAAGGRGRAGRRGRGRRRGRGASRPGRGRRARRRRRGAARSGLAAERPQPTQRRCGSAAAARRYDACSAEGAALTTWSEPVPSSAWWDSRPQ